jgi:3-carboxy-cis,cis-muconate cycloisomerase
MSLFDPLFGTPETTEALSDRARVQAMLDFEAALARAEAKVGVIPAEAAAAIAVACDASRFDLAALAAAAPLGATLAIPLVKALTAAVADPDAARWVHWGATSQDVVDTGMVLQLRAARGGIDADLQRLDAALAELAKAHAATPMAGRTLMQQALPTTFGLKAAGWLSQLRRTRVRLALAAELSLTLPDMPWHTQRDRPADLAGALGLLAGLLGKMARDLTLMMQTEVGEAFEPAGAGKGGSSAMPHKRNPVNSAVAIAAATRVPGLVSTMLSAMVQEHERSAGAWHAEWETLPQIVRLTAGSLRQMTPAMEGLEVDPARMAANLALTGGLPMAEAVTVALAERIGRREAHALVERASKVAVAAKTGLAEALAADPEVTAYLTLDEIARAMRPQNYLGEAAALVARVLDPPKT